MIDEESSRCVGRPRINVKICPEAYPIPKARAHNRGFQEPNYKQYKQYKQHKLLFESNMPSLVTQLNVAKPSLEKAI